MSEVREVTEWHQVMEGTLTVAGERIEDAARELIEATGLPRLLVRIARWIGGGDG